MINRTFGKIGTTTLITYPYHKSSLCTNCNIWYPKSKKIMRCKVCKSSLRLWPKKGLNKDLYKKMLANNEKQRIRTSRYKKNHKEKISNYNKEYYKKNKLKIKVKKNYKSQLTASKKWKQKNLEKIKTYRKRYYQEIEKPRRSKLIVK